MSLNNLSGYVKALLLGLLVTLIFTIAQKAQHPLEINDATFLRGTFRGFIGYILMLSLFILWQKNVEKATILAVFLSISNYWFEPLYRIYAHIPYINRYFYFIVIIFVIIIFCGFFLKRKKEDLSPMLNKLLIVACFTMVISLVQHSRSMKSVPKYPIIGSELDIKQNPDNPDICLVLFDAYTSSSFLKEERGYDNTSFDSFLTQKGFKIFPQSTSNYSRTAYSMASIFNSNYLPQIVDNTVIDSLNTHYALQHIQQSSVIKGLAKAGYNLLNYSPFYLGEQAPFSEHESYFFPNDRWLFKPCMSTFIKNEILKNYFHVQNLQGLIKTFSDAYDVQRYSEKVLEKGMKIAPSNKNPNFIYLHFLMPHPPFYCNVGCGQQDPDHLFQYNKNRNPQEYNQYLKPTNEYAKLIINHLLSVKSKRELVIIFAGDHGFSYKGEPKSWEFKNYKAIYSSRKAYLNQCEDSSSMVNLFPELFSGIYNIPLKREANKYFSVY